MKVLGGIFTGLGVLLLYSQSAMYFETLKFDHIMGMIVGFVFLWVGLSVLKVVLVETLYVREAARNGKTIKAKIINYGDNWSTVINGVPYATIIVEFCKDAKLLIGEFDINATRTDKYPIGDTVDIVEYNKDYILIKR